MTLARTSGQWIRLPRAAYVVLKMPSNGAARAFPTAKMKDANPTLFAPAAWKMKSSARNATTIPAITQTASHPGDPPDHTLVFLRRTLAPVAGSATVWVVVLTPVRFDP